MTINRVPSVPFAQIANAALRDTRLSYKARGILAMVLSNAGEWHATSEWIVQQSVKDGPHAVQTALNELSEAGYRVVRTERDKDGRVRTVTDWFHDPIIRPAENPGTGKSGLRATDPALEHQLTEHNGTEEHNKQLTAAYDDDFLAFWSAYPRHVGKREAHKVWLQVIKIAHPADIIQGARRYASDPHRVDQYTAHPTTWLRRGGWEDDPLPTPTGGRVTGGEARMKQYAELSAKFRQGQQGELEA